MMMIFVSYRCVNKMHTYILEEKKICSMNTWTHTVQEVVIIIQKYLYNEGAFITYTEEFL